MRRSFAIALAALTAVTYSQLITLPLTLRKHPPPNRANLDDRIDQRPLNMDPVGPALPPSDAPAGGGPPPAPGHGTVMLSDVMGRDRSINIFAGLTRDVASITKRLDDSDHNSTVLAPLNSAIEGLPRKPWEDAGEYEAFGANAYEGGDGQQRAQRNIQRFVAAHVIPMNPWPEKEKARPVMEGAKEVWWEEKDGAKVILPDNIEVACIASTVANGEVWILKGVRNYTER